MRLPYRPGSSRLEFATAAVLAVSARLVLMSAVAILAMSGPASSGGKPSATRGAAVVDQWCRLCHQRPGETADPDMAPPFETLAQRPGRDRSFYIRFMSEDHFPMTTFRLFENEKQDVVEYLLTLARQ